VLISSLQPEPRNGLVAEAIRQMARDLREYDRRRLGDVDEVLARSIVALANRLGRQPTARETADAAGLDVEDVIDARLRRLPPAA
jgi:DNA-directed RNA polymerase specialized sigma subunit